MAFRARQFPMKRTCPSRIASSAGSSNERPMPRRCWTRLWTSGTRISAAGSTSEGTRWVGTSRCDVTGRVPAGGTDYQTCASRTFVPSPDATLPPSLGSYGGTSGDGAAQRACPYLSGGASLRAPLHHLPAALLHGVTSSKGRHCLRLLVDRDIRREPQPVTIFGHRDHRTARESSHARQRLQR
jgi:hypothetical protein